MSTSQSNTCCHGDLTEMTTSVVRPWWCCLKKDLCVKNTRWCAAGEGRVALPLEIMLLRVGRTQHSTALTIVEWLKASMFVEWLQASKKARFWGSESCETWVRGRVRRRKERKMCGVGEKNEGEKREWERERKKENVQAIKTVKYSTYKYLHSFNYCLTEFLYWFVMGVIPWERILRVPCCSLCHSP